MINGLKHFYKVCKHKFFVGKYCFMAGIRWRGIKHDISKFSPVEFFESVKYYQGNRSPIDACKEANGYSKAWMHHKGRNSHHYEYWVDNFDNGGTPVKMPFKDACELICDYLGAGRAYMGRKFTYAGEYEWWHNKRQHSLAMHPHTMLFVDMILHRLKMLNDPKAVINKRYLQLIYNVSERLIEYDYNVH